MSVHGVVGVLTSPQGHRWLADLAAETEVRRRALEALASALGFGTASGSEVTLRILAVAAGRRRRGIGRALLRAFESSALRLRATRVSLGADAEAGFYIRHGYQTTLLLQWAL